MSATATMYPSDPLADSFREKFDEVDLKDANILATGMDKQQLRVVNGFGSLMGSK